MESEKQVDYKLEVLKHTIDSIQVLMQKYENEDVLDDKLFKLVMRDSFSLLTEYKKVITGTLKK